MNKNHKYVISLLLFSIIIFCHAKEILQVYDIKGNIKTLQEVSENKPLIIVFFSTYTCINCNYELNSTLDKLLKKISFKVIVLSRLSEAFNIIDAYKEKKLIKTYYPKFDVYFDIHNSDDSWPPKNLQGGLFQFYKVEKFPAILIVKSNFIKYLPYEFLFNDKVDTSLFNILENSIKN